MFFIAGITGQVGGAATHRLLEEGRQVVALARDPRKAAALANKGVEVRQGDLNDPAAVADALKGVDAAFLMMPPTLPTPGYPEAKATVASYAEALRRSPPPRLVVLSSFGSEKASGLGNITSTQLLEQALANASFPVAFIRPGSFMENYGYALHQAEATGAFDILLDPVDRAVPMTATIDIGAMVAALLTGTWTGRKVVELGDRYSPNDLARALSDMLGRNVVARSTPREHWATSLGYMGVPEASIPFYEEMMDGINAGWIDHGVTDTEPVAGSTTPLQIFTRLKELAVEE
jgi:uncharacterized protein YbjT (DUF2867 family)